MDEGMGDGAATAGLMRRARKPALSGPPAPATSSESPSWAWQLLGWGGRQGPGWWEGVTACAGAEGWGSQEKEKAQQRSSLLPSKWHRPGPSEQTSEPGSRRNARAAPLTLTSHPPLVPHYGLPASPLTAPLLPIPSSSPALRITLKPGPAPRTALPVVYPPSVGCSPPQAPMAGPLSAPTSQKQSPMARQGWCRDVC